MIEPEPRSEPEPVDDEGRFAEQVLLALDGQLGPEGDAALRDELATDAEKRRLFVRLCLQTQSLLEIFGAPRQDQVPDGRDRESLGLRRARRGRRAWLPWVITAAACLLAMLRIASVRRANRPAP